jgi:hypothetical protein
MEQASLKVASGMSMGEVRSVLGEPDRTHVFSFGHQILTSWIYHSEPDPMCVWFDSADKVKLTSRNCAESAVSPAARASARCPA